MSVPVRKNLWGLNTGSIWKDKWPSSVQIFSTIKTELENARRPDKECILSTSLFWDVFLIFTNMQLCPHKIYGTRVGTPKAWNLCSAEHVRTFLTPPLSVITTCTINIQSVENAAARLTFRIRRSEHITPALISLHWLRVPERISFKLAVMTYRSIHGTSRSYLQSCFTRVADMTSWRRLRSSTSHRLGFPPIRFYSRPAGVSGFWCHRVKRPASPRRICAVTRGFQTPTRDLSVFQDSCVSITIHH